jgi:beta-N-acetylhexosaminidase
VNLNFAPVVDLNQGVINPNDKYSQIYRRAIASDPKVVAQVATWYCQALREFHVTCTMKHFPGLGRVTNDTHVEAADLATPIAELEKTDWVPFRQLMQTSRAFVMLSHAKLRAIDDQFATSFSEKVIRDLIRQQWNYQGILITDDFSMMAAYRAPGGVEQAVVRSLNSGTDLILVSYDHELYYELIHAAITSGSCNLSDCKLSSRSQEISRLLPRFAIASRVTHRNRPLSPSKQFNAESP